MDGTFWKFKASPTQVQEGRLSGEPTNRHDFPLIKKGEKRGRLSMNGRKRRSARMSAHQFLNRARAGPYKRHRARAGRTSLWIRKRVRAWPVKHSGNLLAPPAGARRAFRCPHAFRTRTLYEGLVSGRHISQPIVMKSKRSGGKNTRRALSTSKKR